MTGYRLGVLIGNTIMAAIASGAGLPDLTHLCAGGALAAALLQTISLFTNNRSQP